MDDFGFLVQQYGIKPNSKSTPMAPIKPNANIHDSKSLYWDLDFGTQFVSGSSKFIESSNLVTKSLIDDDDESNDQWDALFQAPIKSSNNSGSVSSSGNGDFHLGSLLGGSQRVKSKPESFDLLDGFGPRNANESDAVEEWRVASVEMEDLLSSNTKVGDSIGDILGSLGTMESVTSIRSRDSGSRDCRKEEVDVDDLIPGCGETVVMDASRRTQASSADNRVGVLLIEELGDPAIDRTTKNADSHVKQAVNMRNMHEQWAEDLIDMGEISGSGGTHAENEKVYTRKVDVDEVREMTNQSHSEVDLDSFFSGHSGISASSPERNADRKATPDVPDLFSQTSSGLEKKFPGLSFSDSISSTNVEGEDKERRNARFERYQKTEACMAQALADINQRDFQVQLEQEERHRIAETVDMEMKHWAAGKEGNLRALLSSLQQVLWAGCGWNPVSLADLITPYQVKMVYKKAALCVHPDKVQQRGASVQQKYIAEKVFHLLKEAWKKFSSEELR